MVIFINDEKKDVPVDLSIGDLFNELNFSSTQGLAIAINQQIILKKDWTSTLLKENDQVLIISATKGG